MAYLEIDPEKIDRVFTGPDGRYALKAHYVDISRELDFEGLYELNLEKEADARKYIKAVINYNNSRLVLHYLRTRVGFKYKQATLNRKTLTEKIPGMKKEDPNVNIDVDDWLRKIERAVERRRAAEHRYRGLGRALSTADFLKLAPWGEERYPAPDPIDKA